MADSTVPLVKAALKALFAATATDAEVIYGPRGPVVVGGTVPNVSKVVQIGNAEGEDTPAGFGPNRPTFEDYHLTIVCSVTIAGPAPESQVAATEAALALRSLLRTAVLAQPNEDLGVAGVAWARPLASWSLVESDDAEVVTVARNAAVTWRVEVRARI